MPCVLLSCGQTQPRIFALAAAWMPKRQRTCAEACSTFLRLPLVIENSHSTVRSELCEEIGLSLRTPETQEPVFAHDFVDAFGETKRGSTIQIAADRRARCVNATPQGFTAHL
jgi:hypothetical protein